MRFERAELLVFLLVVPPRWGPPCGSSAAVPRARRPGRPPGCSRTWSRAERLAPFLPIGLLLAGLTLLLVGFARPQATIHVKRQDATVVVVLDVSGSMAANDAPPTRLGAARAAANRLVDHLPKGYRMAVITFSDHAAVVQPPTRDLERHPRSDQACPHRAAGNRARRRGRAWRGGRAHRPCVVGHRPPAVVVLFSDGGQTAGSVTPQQAAAAARKARVPVSAVSVGTPDGIVQQQLQGGYTERIQVPVQPNVLQTIAQGSGGRFYPHVVGFDPAGTYAELGSRVGKEPKRVEVTAAAAAGGLVFMLAGGLLSGVWFRRMP